MDREQLLNTGDAAKYTGLSASTLNKLRLTGGGPIFSRLAGRSIRYKRNDLDAWIEAQRVGSTSEAPDIPALTAVSANAPAGAKNIERQAQVASCDQCRFFKPPPYLGGEPIELAHTQFSKFNGSCRRNAPQFRFTTKFGAETYTPFPPIRPTDWCGEFKKK